MGKDLEPRLGKNLHLALTPDDIVKRLEFMAKYKVLDMPVAELTQEHMDWLRCPAQFDAVDGLPVSIQFKNGDDYSF